MRILHADKGMTRMQVGVAVAVVLALSLLVVFLVRQEDTPWLHGAYPRSVQKLQLIQAMSRDLLASAEAEKSAVMVETDEASEAFAAQSRQASDQVEKARRELEPLLEGKHQEMHQFREFSQCWDTLQAIDREVLSLAVQNTNLKAFRLSFGPAAAAVRRMEDALTHLMEVGASSPNAVPLTRLAVTAVMGALNIYMLHAPHIVESTETRMDEMEASMQSHDTQVTTALQSLRALVDESGQPWLEAAWAAYRDLRHLNGDIVELSRQNSNVRSYALSLGQKRKMTAQCQDVLTALQETVRQSMAYTATK